MDPQLTARHLRRCNGAFTTLAKLPIGNGTFATVWRTEIRSFDDESRTPAALKAFTEAFDITEVGA